MLCVQAGVLAGFKKGYGNFFQLVRMGAQLDQLGLGDNFKPVFFLEGNILQLIKITFYDLVLC